MVIFIGWYISFNFFSVKDVEVPNLIGLSEEEARIKIEPLKLNLEVEGKDYSDSPEGTIIKMNPEYGIKVKEGSTIKVRISLGQKMVKVPDLTGLDIIDADIILKNNGLKEVILKGNIVIMLIKTR